MTTGTALLRAILDEPADDLHRLAYADWLDEQGQEERAAYIRWAIDERPARPQPRVRYRQWFPPWWEGASFCHRRGPREHAVGRVRQPQGLVGHFYVCKGFVAAIHLPLDDFLRHAKTLFAHHPITEVVLTDREPSPYVGRMTCHPWLTSRGSPFTGDDSHPVIPEAIYDLLDGGRWLDPRPSHREWYAYPTSDDARAAISRACVTYGRQQAGLPPLLTK